MKTLVLSALLSLPVAAAPVCHTLDVPGSSYTQLWQVNTAGQVAASSDQGAFIYSGGSWLPLPPAPGYPPADVGALGINDSGVITGFAFDEGSGIEQGFILHGESYTFFNWNVDPDFPGVQPRAISNSGLVSGTELSVNAEASGVGFVYNPGSSAVSGYGAGFTPLFPVRDGVEPFQVIPGSMNDSGLLVGSAFYPGQGKSAFTYDPSTGTYNVFRYNGLRSAARGITNSGTIVGFSVNPGDPNGAGILWTLKNGVFTEIDCSDIAPGNLGLYSEGINESGVISGGYATPDGNIHGVLIYQNVILPVSGDAYDTNVAAGEPTFLGATLADGYAYTSAGPAFASVRLPIGIGKNVYTVIANGQAIRLAAGERLDFAGGVTSFKVLGVDPAAGVPQGPSAFVSELTFASSGRLTGSIHPMTVADEVNGLVADVSAGPGRSLQAKAQVRIVSPGLPRTTPRYPEAVVMNTALGGGFTSLLVDAIRVDRGLSYSVSTRLHMNRRAGLSIFASFTKNETLRELVDVALEKMRGYAAAGPSEDALDKARRYLAGLFPLGLESHEALAEQVADAILDGLGLDHLAKYRSRVLAVQAEQARAAAADLSPARDGAQLIVVGEADVARRALNGLCPVEIRQLEEFA